MLLQNKLTQHYNQKTNINSFVTVRTSHLMQRKRAPDIANNILHLAEPQTSVLQLLLTLA